MVVSCGISAFNQILYFRKVKLHSALLMRR
jgi:hypothetical protein